MRHPGLLLALVAALAACSADSGSSPGAGVICAAGKTEPCACPGGAQGAQACRSDGKGYLECVCPGGPSGAGGSAGLSSGGSAGGVSSAGGAGGSDAAGGPGGGAAGGGGLLATGGAGAGIAFADVCTRDQANDSKTASPPGTGFVCNDDSAPGKPHAWRCTIDPFTTKFPGCTYMGMGGLCCELRAHPYP